MKLRKNFSLKNQTTFRIGGRAKYFCIVKNKDDLIRAVQEAKRIKVSFFVLGGGSNVLFSDKGYNGLVAKCQIDFKRLLKENKNHVEVCVGAGTKLDDLVRLSIKKSLTGAEWLAGIPGTVGGAVFGAVQAFGGKISDIVKSVEVFDVKTNKIKTFSKKRCGFFSKNSIFKKKKNLIILSAVFKLKKGKKEEIKNKIREYFDYRKRNHPVKFPSAGSVFINPKKKIKDKKLLREYPELKKFNKKGEIPAGFLIEKCGLKGKRVGGAKISEKHANFIVNLKNAKAKDVIELIKLIKKRVKNKFKIDLKEEIQIIN